MMHKFRIEPLEDNRFKTYIDDKKVRLSKVDVRLRVDEVPSVKVEFCGEPEMDGLFEIELSDMEVLYMVSKRLENKEFAKKLQEIVDGHRDQ